ncbi:unnamed protein product [Lactuca saligna]|uniref:Uncharacterized protein n=1 Tax=Lactuca saligna TaxID=75948 RepID=A0AA35YPX0_LACSI|nr:unnamed protein product [Lactuca saligna]
MSTIDPKVETGKFLTKEGASPSKKSRTSKKTEFIIPEEIVKETKTSKSPKSKADEEPGATRIVTEPTSVTIPSKARVFCKLKLKYGGSPTSNVIHKPHHTHQGVLMHEVLAPVSPHSKKRRAEDMANKISKKKKKTKMRKLVIPMESSEVEQVPKTPEHDPLIQPTSPEKTVFIPPEVLSTKLSHEEVRTSYITANVSHTGANVNMGKGDLTKETTHLHKVLQLLFQPTNPPKPNDESENEGGFGSTFEDLAFDEDEGDFPDHMLMSMKQFKIVNKKLNSIIQSQADTGG